MCKNNLQKGFALPAVLILVLAVALGAFYFSTKKNSTPVSIQDSGIVLDPEEVAIKDARVSVNLTKDAADVATSGTYEAYDVSKLSKAVSGEVILFFRASWCPTCRTLDADIKANLQSIPSELTILDVDYDNSTALKQKYGVTYQHTLVQVDKDGNLIKKWSGSPTLASIISQL